jgi:hypothetical protein
MMKRLDPRFIEAFSIKTTHLMKAIRHIQTLEDYLPDGFPEPAEIVLAQRPYDLEVIWEAANKKHAESLCSRITNMLECDGKWYMYNECSLVCRSRVCVGGKASLNLTLRIEGPEPT